MTYHTIDILAGIRMMDMVQPNILVPLSKILLQFDKSQNV